jgi:hypothetical protein
MKKRILAVVLTIVLALSTALSVAPVEKASADYNCIDCWGWRYNNTVCDYVETYATNVTVIVGGGPNGRLLQADFYQRHYDQCSICGRFYGYTSGFEYIGTHQWWEY